MQCRRLLKCAAYLAGGRNSTKLPFADDGADWLIDAENPAGEPVGLLRCACKIGFAARFMAHQREMVRLSRNTLLDPLAAGPSN
jgi:hypothetical protein